MILGCRTVGLWIATLSLSWIIVSRLQVIHFVLLRKTIVHFFGVTSAFPRFTRSAPLTKQYLIVLFGRVQNPPQ